MDNRALAELRALERRDDVLQERAQRLRDLDEEVTGIRAEAEALGAFEATHPAQLDRLRREVAEAEDELERRREEAARARAAEEDASDDVARQLARRAIERADDHVAVAEREVGEAHERLSELRQWFDEAPAALAALRARAATVRAAAPETPYPDSTHDLVEWASHAHAELFVAAGHTDAERDRVVREANELASMLLGESTYGLTVAQARSRVEASP
jgi:chromosome segregation ATPase